jgi:hypothetical protein
MSSTEYKSLHRTGTSSTMVTYRDGSEVQDTDTQPGKNQSKSPKVLKTVGEFGPILAIVMGDAMRGEVTWQRWEQGASEPVAVFRYVVPEEQSNYLVVLSPEDKIKDIYPGYGGEIAIDPATGAILRISVVSGLPPPYQAMQTAILVEYAPVTIGASGIGGQRADAVKRRCLYAVSLVPLESANCDRRKRTGRCAGRISGCSASARACSFHGRDAFASATIAAAGAGLRRGSARPRPVPGSMYPGFCFPNLFAKSAKRMGHGKIPVETVRDLAL